MINKNPTQIISDTIQDKSQVINLPSASSGRFIYQLTSKQIFLFSYLENKFDESHHTLTILNQSLEANNQQLKKYYQHLLNRFDFMCILNQYHLNEVR